jgi:hypothetical protein
MEEVTCADVRTGYWVSPCAWVSAGIRTFGGRAGAPGSGVDRSQRSCWWAAYRDLGVGLIGHE